MQISPEIIQAALKQVLAGMQMHANKMKGGMFKKPDMAPMSSDEGDDSAAPPMMMEGDAAKPDGSPEEEASDPSDDELEEMMRGRK